MGVEGNPHPLNGTDNQVRTVQEFGLVVKPITQRTTHVGTWGFDNVCSWRKHAEKKKDVLFKWQSS